MRSGVGSCETHELNGGPSGPVALELDAGYLVWTSDLVVSCSAWFGFSPSILEPIDSSSISWRASHTLIPCSESRHHNFKGWQCTSLGESRYPCSHHGIGCPLAAS